MSLADLKVQRYSKPITLIKLKDDDRVISTTVSQKEVFIVTENGYGLRYMTDEVPVTGLRGSGVKAINLKTDVVVSGLSFDDIHYLAFITDKNTAKRVKLGEFEITSRARKGVLVVRDVKTNPYHIIKAFAIKNKVDLGLVTSDIKYIKVTELPICDRYQTGSSLAKEKIKDVFVKALVNENLASEEIDVSLDHIDEKIMTIDDFLEDFKIE